MKRRHLPLMLLLAGMSMGATADDKNVNVLYHDGTSHAMKMSEVEKIEINGSSIRVVPKDGNPESHVVADIEKIELTDVSAGISSTTNAAGLSVTAKGALITVSGNNREVTAELFNAAGQLVKKVLCGQRRTEINIEPMPAGTYIIKVDTITMKFNKK